MIAIGKEIIKVLNRRVLLSVLLLGAGAPIPELAALKTVPAHDALPNLSRMYRCVNRSPNLVDRVTQSGDQIEFKSDNGLVGNAKLTSRISLSGLPPWNSLGTNYRGQSHPMVEWYTMAKDVNKRCDRAIGAREF